MKLHIELSYDEIQRYLPYGLICETLESSAWGTRRRKKLWKEMFNSSEKESARRIFAQAHNWYLKTGAPDSIVMSVKTYDLWQKIADFCAMI